MKVAKPISEAGVPTIQWNGDLISITPFSSPEPIVVTPNHLILTQDGWKEAGKLRPFSMRIEEFATFNDLELEVKERTSYHPGGVDRFYANFFGAEVKDGSMLRGAYGDGHTREEAIANYAKEISGTLLVVDAYRSTRREIRVPQLIWEPAFDRYPDGSLKLKDIVEEVKKRKPKRMIQI